MDFSTAFLESARSRFRSQKNLADKAIAQVADDDLHHPLHSETNSIAVIMKHMAGNMISRWTDFLSSDGEKPWRNRDREFVDAFGTRNGILEFWEDGWQKLFETLDSLTVEDLSKTVQIRGESLSVPDAIHRQLDHYGYHIGQIIMIARIQVGDSHWATLSIPRGGSEEFNQRYWQE